MMMTKRFILVFLIICLVLLFTNLYGTDEGLGPQFENVDPTTSQFIFKHGSGDPGYTGDLSLDLPLLTVPGRRGLNFDINLQYVMGNGVPAAQAASWVGLGWNLNMYEIKCSPTYKWISGIQSHQLGSDGADIYYLNFPGGSTPLAQFGDGNWYPLNWSAIQIKADSMSTPDATWNIENDYTKFEVTDINGIKYIFAEKLRQTSTRPLTNHTESNPSGNEYGYHYVFKLTAILGTHYYDSNRNDIPDTGDRGGWIRLDYGNKQDIEDLLPEVGDYPSTEINYLDSIVTPTHTAEFVLSSTSNRNYIYDGLIREPVKSLDSIILKKGTETIKKISFETSNSFSWIKRNGSSNLLVTDTDDYRLRLDRVVIYDKDDNSLPPYEFLYNNDDPQTIDGTYLYVDPWGFPSLVKPQEVDTSDVNWLSWLIESVHFPAGYTETYEYESDMYETYHLSWRDSVTSREILSGGVRLTKKVVKSPQSEDSLVYEYEYGKSLSDIGSGLISGEPGDWGTPNGYTTSNSIGANVRTEVHYPYVQITFPDGSRKRTYYTSAVSGLYMSLNNYNAFDKCYETVTQDSDSYVLNLNTYGDGYLNSNLTVVFGPSIDASYQHQPFPSGVYNYANLTEYELCVSEAHEYDDFNFEWYYNIGDFRVNVQIFNNAWKRGHIVREEFLRKNKSVPTFEKLYYYTMVPVKTELFDFWATNKEIGVWVKKEIGALMTSGWAKVCSLYTRNYDEGGGEWVTKLVEYKDFDEDNGLARRIDVMRSDSIEHITIIDYAHDQYPAMKSDSVYMLSQVAQKSIHKDHGPPAPYAGSSIVTTYDDRWSAGKWNSYQSWKWIEDDPGSIDDFDFDDYVSQDDEWIKITEVKDRDVHGNILEIEDANQTVTATKWGINSSRPIASIVNGEHDESYVDGFGDDSLDDDPINWTVSGANWDVEEGVLGYTSPTATSGYHCSLNEQLDLDYDVIEFDALVNYTSGSGGNWAGIHFRKTSISHNINQSGYLLFVRYNGQVELVRATGTSTSPVGGPYELADRGGEWNYTHNQWHHFRIEVNGNNFGIYADGKLIIDVTDSTYSGINSYVGFTTYETIAYFDNFRVYPLNALCSSISYDPSSRNVENKVDENGVSSFYEYDSFNRLIRTKDTHKNIVSEYAYYFSRNQNDNYNPRDPNYLRSISYASELSEGLYGNIAPNRGFELNHVGKSIHPISWPYDIYSGPDSCYSIDSTGINNTQCIKIDNSSLPGASDNTSVVSDYIPVTGGEVYNLSGSIKTSSTSARAYLGMEWFTINNTRIKYEYVAPNVHPTSWQHYSGNKTAPSNACFVRIWLLNYNTAHIVYFDEINLVRSSSEQDIESVVTTSFFDELGNEFQTQNQTGEDKIISYKTFDEFGRIIKAYKPFLKQNSDHHFVDSAPTYCNNYYDGNPGPDCDNYPYTQYVYLDWFGSSITDPSSNYWEIGFPGDIFSVDGSYSIEYEYDTSESDDGGLDDRYKIVVEDENGIKSSAIYDNFANKVGEIKNHGSGSGNSINIMTQYEYDVVGNLVKIIHPLAFSSSGTDINKITGWEDYCTHMAYNTLGQLIEKSTPDLDADNDGDPLDERVGSGATPDIKYKYNKLGNLRFVQDANLKQGGSDILFYQYDEFNRLKVIGIVTNNDYVPSWDDLVPDSLYDNGQHNFEDLSTHGNHIRTQYFYDGEEAYTGACNLIGNISCVKYKTSSDAVFSMTYYSYTPEGFVEWIVQDILGELEKKISYEYDLLGNLVKIGYDEDDDNEFFIWYEYNDLNQLVKVFSSQTGDTKPQYADAIYSYWPTGQVDSVIIGEQAADPGYLEKLKYEYNERDWLTNINAPNGVDEISVTSPDTNFAEVLYYNSTPGTARYNGDITAAEYFTNRPNGSDGHTYNSFGHRYIFAYDSLSRLTSADYDYLNSGAWSTTTAFDLNSVSYDKMGNFSSLTRKDESGSGSARTYNYKNSDTNWLDWVNGYHSSSGNYSYDNNGNVTADSYKSLGLVDYNYQNLPMVYGWSDGDSIRTAYDFDGNRVHKSYDVDDHLVEHYYIRGTDGKTIAVYNEDKELLFINLYGLDLIGKIY